MYLRLLTRPRGLEFALYEVDLARSIAADSAFTSAQQPLAMEHIEVVGIEVNAGDLIPVARITRSIWIRKRRVRTQSCIWDASGRGIRN